MMRYGDWIVIVRERIWFSPHCIRETKTLFDLHDMEES
jgi:hypothetical protein